MFPTTAGREGGRREERGERGEERGRKGRREERRERGEEEGKEGGERRGKEGGRRAEWGRRKRTESRREISNITCSPKTCARHTHTHSYICPNTYDTESYSNTKKRWTNSPH